MNQGDQQSFSVKGHIVNSSGFLDLRSLAGAQLCPVAPKQPGQELKDWPGCILVQIHLHEYALAGFSLWTVVCRPWI